MSKPNGTKPTTTLPAVPQSAAGLDLRPLHQLARRVRILAHAVHGADAGQVRYWKLHEAAEEVVWKADHAMRQVFDTIAGLIGRGCRQAV